MARDSGWGSVSLPAAPIRRQTPEEREATAALFDAYVARYLHDREARERRKARTTPAQRARRAAQDGTRKLRALLRETAEAARWEHITAALDDLGMQADAAKANADRLRASVTRRTRRVYQRAADGCMVSADFIADESADELYRMAFTKPGGSPQQ